MSAASDFSQAQRRGRERAAATVKAAALKVADMVIADAIHAYEKHADTRLEFEALPVIPAAFLDILIPCVAEAIEAAVTNTKNATLDLVLKT